MKQKLSNLWGKDGTKSVLASLISILIGMVVGALIIIIVGAANPSLGLNSAWEGIRLHNFFGTYLVGPILVMNPPFTKYLLRLIGAGDVPLAFEKENMEAYAQRKKDFAEKVR